MEMESEPKVKDEFDDLNLEARQPPTVRPTLKALSDGSRDESPTPTYKHRWTLPQRITLAMLAENYSNSWDDITSVFNRFHVSDLRKCGGLRSSVVYTQYRHIRRYFDLEAALRQLQATLSPYERTKLASRAHLEQKAVEIGVQLIEKKLTDISCQGGLSGRHDVLGRNKRKRVDILDDAKTHYLPDETDNEDRSGFDVHTVQGLTAAKTPTKATGKQQQNGLLTPPDSRQRKIPRLTLEKKLARIGFRAFTSQTQGTYSSALGIRAGAFLNCSDIPLAADRSATEYREEAL